MTTSDLADYTTTVQHRFAGDGQPWGIVNRIGGLPVERTICLQVNLIYRPGQSTASVAAERTVLAWGHDQVGNTVCVRVDDILDECCEAMRTEIARMTEAAAMSLAIQAGMPALALLPARLDDKGLEA